jgi:muramoyltetrapeptide carboxypeptidase
MTKCLSDLGFAVKHSRHILSRTAYTAGTKEDRAADLNEAFNDEDVRAVFFAWGGKGANQLLPLLDYNRFRDDPKIILGLSDPTSILNALFATTGTITFHGPTGVNFSAENGLDEFTRRSLIQTICEKHQAMALPEHSQWEALRFGTARGHLVGGHLSTLQTLLGTPYEPKWDGGILFWEEVARAPRNIDHCLMHFRLRGVFEKISGMVIGRPLACEDTETPQFNVDFRQMVLSLCQEYRFPILFNVDLGHADPKLTLPIGAMAELKLSPSGNSFTLEESGVE